MDVVEQHKSYGPASLAFAVITASDSRSEADDESGAKIAAMAAAAGHRVVQRTRVPDEADRIRQAVLDALSEAEVVVLNGGTGFGGRDVSVDAVQGILERPIEGFGELFRALSFQQIGAAAMLSRAMAGVVGGRVVFVTPGSPQAVELAMSALILPEAAHLIGQLRRREGSR